MENDLVGKRIEILEMIDETNPVESGTKGTIYHVGAGVINVNWDNGRTLGVLENIDTYKIL